MFSSLFLLLFHLIFLRCVCVAVVVVFNRADTVHSASRSASHCHCNRSVPCFRFEKGCFSVMFLYSVIGSLSLVHPLTLIRVDCVTISLYCYEFCRHQNSYLLLKCLVECQQEGVLTTFPHFHRLCLNHTRLGCSSVFCFRSHSQSFT